MSGRRIVFAGVLLAALAACESPVTRATGPTGPELPPIGLAATAVWLDQRQAGVAAPAARAQDIPTSQIRSVASGEVTSSQAVRTSGQGIILPGIIEAFRIICIEGAPKFLRAPSQRSLTAARPAIEAGLEVNTVVSPGRSCAVNVPNYGNTRPTPDVQDLAVLATELQDRFGGTITTPGGSARDTEVKLRKGLSRYILRSNVDNSGTLFLSVRR